MKTKIIVANWKMHKTLEEIRTFASAFLSKHKKAQNIEAVIAPPFTGLLELRDLLKDSGVKLAAQNCFHVADGPYTGEISPAMLKDVGCEYVIVGHSERRQHFGETDQIVENKVAAALQHGLKPILCIGETLDERQAGKTEMKVVGQLDAALQKTHSSQMGKIVIAYEPVWAIGSGETASPSDAHAVATLVHDWIASKWGVSAAGSVRILYGGSVKPENAQEILKQPNIDGALVGSSSLDPDTFNAIIHAASAAKS